MTDDMTYRSDFALRAVDGTILALVEVKNREDLSPEVAASIRRNRIVHGLHPARYFLLLSQDKGYIWRDGGRGGRSAPPTAEFSMKEVIGRYLPDRDPTERLKGVQLELIIGKWLDDMTTGMLRQPTSAETALASTRFLDDIEGASVLVESHV